MSLKAKIQPYMFALGLIFSLFSFNSVFAYSENFDSYTNNYYLKDVSSWTVSGDSTNSKIKNTTFVSSPNSALLGNSLYNRYVPGSAVNYNYTTSFDIKMHFVNNYDVIVMPHGSNLNWSWMLRFNGNNTRTVKAQDTSIIFSNLITDTWYHVDIEVSFNNSNSRFNVNNSGWSDWINFSYTHTDTTDISFGVSPDYGAGGITYIDNFYLSESYVEGTCGDAYGQVLTTIPPENSYACSSGTMIDFNGGLNELGTGIKFFWECEGSGGGYSVACSSAETLAVINGACGSANGQTISSAPYEYQKCSSGATNGSILETLNGWTWSCYGFNGGSTDFCSAIYEDSETPPIIPDSSIIPTPTDCDSYSGIDKILCNLGNVIQGMFLPSSEKVIELQTIMNEVGNVFPFNYLRAISSVFNNLNFYSGSLTMTIWGNTETLGADFLEMGLFDNIKLGVTILILLMFTFWAIGYIKHFFK